MVLCILTLNTNAQNEFAYQLRVNVIPLPSFQYAGAYRIGIESVSRKVNFGLDFVNYTVRNSTSSVYYRDSSFFYRRDISRRIFSNGLALNISRAINFKSNRNRLILGFQAYVGMNRLMTSNTDHVFDTLYPGSRNSQVPAGYEGISITSGKTNYIGHGPKASFGFTPFIRLELAINKRFTFSPELQMPLILSNETGGSFSAGFMQGFNFCLGYKFLKT